MHMSMLEANLLLIAAGLGHSNQDSFVIHIYIHIYLNVYNSAMSANVRVHSSMHNICSLPSTQQILLQHSANLAPESVQDTTSPCASHHVVCWGWTHGAPITCPLPAPAVTGNSHFCPVLWDHSSRAAGDSPAPSV